MALPLPVKAGLNLKSQYLLVELNGAILTQNRKLIRFFVTRYMTFRVPMATERTTSTTNVRCKMKSHSRYVFHLILFFNRIQIAYWTNCNCVNIDSSSLIPSLWPLSFSSFLLKFEV